MKTTMLKNVVDKLNDNATCIFYGANKQEYKVISVLELKQKERALYNIMVKKVVFDAYYVNIYVESFY